MHTGSYMPQMNSNEPAKPHATIEKWVWILIYGGLFLVILGIATGRTDESLGWMVAAPGALFVAVGAALIYVRSRLT